MSKLPHIGTSIFSTMSELALKHNAINLSQGFPNFPVNPKLISIVQELVTQNVHQYTPMAGHPELLVKIALLTKQSYRRDINPATEILITAGATQGIFTTIQALIQAEDEVIILDPSYDCYETPVLLCNAKPIRVSLNDDYTPNWPSIKTAFSNRTKMIIINNPHNPTGKTWSQMDFESLEKILDDYPNAMVLSDEVYEYISFESPMISANTRNKLINKTIVISSFGKSFHITGWKIGYVIAPQNLMIEIKKVHQFVVFSVNSISQMAINHYLDHVNLKEIRKMYQAKRDLFRKLLENSRFKLLDCEGTYFQVASYEGISTENDVEFCTRLITQYGVAAIPISPFYATNKDLKLIRFCFAKEDETLIEAAKRLCRI